MPEPKRHDEQTAARNKMNTPPAPATSEGSVTSASADTDPRYEPYPGADFFHGGRYSPVIAAAGARLTREGHAPSGKTLGPDWTTTHRDAWRSYQQELRPKGGGDTSGIPDETAWNQLQVPRVSPFPREA